MTATRLLGNFDRYGNQPFCILYEMGNDKDDDDDAEEVDGVLMTRCVAYQTLMGSHFDGKLKFLVKKTTKDSSSDVVVS